MWRRRQEARRKCCGRREAEVQSPEWKRQTVLPGFPFFLFWWNFSSSQLLIEIEFKFEKAYLCHCTFTDLRLRASLSYFCVDLVSVKRLPFHHSPLFISFFYIDLKLKMESEKKSSAISDVGAWAMNVVSSVGIIMANKQLMSNNGYAFSFGQSLSSQLLFLYVMFGSETGSNRSLISSTFSCILY